MNTERHVGAGKSAFPLTRADVELLRSNVENSAKLDLRFQNLQHIDLSYMDLQGANLQGANLSGANLQGANLSNADLDGADLSRAHLGDTEANHVNLHHAKFNVTPGTCNYPAYVYGRVLFVETKFRKELSYETFYCQSYHRCYARSRLGLASSLASICGY